MIVEALLKLVQNLVISKMPNMNLDFSGVDAALETVRPFVSMACYVLPVDTIRQILSITLAIFAFKIIVALIKTLWDLIPLV